MFHIAVVAHTAREQQAVALAKQVNADHIAWDDGALGCNANHGHAWHQLATADAEWSVIIEDDALPVADFSSHLEQALAAAPSNIVSLYLGTSRPALWQSRIQAATRRADKANAPWIVGSHLLHAVAVAIRTDLVPTMLEHLDGSLPIDDAITKWATSADQPVAYTWPSLVDHRDEPSLMPRKRRNTGPRRAWRHGTPDQWSTRAVQLSH